MAFLSHSCRHQRRSRCRRIWVGPTGCAIHGCGGAGGNGGLDLRAVGVSGSVPLPGGPGLDAVPLGRLGDDRGECEAFSLSSDDEPIPGTSSDEQITLTMMSK